MISKQYDLDLLTKMFITGAHENIAELRATEIRGQLRWWFRALGGFKSDSKSCRDQEKELFGNIEKGHACKSRLTIRVKEKSVIKFAKDANGLEAGQNTALGYLLFPLRDNIRGFLIQTNTQQPAFSIWINWRDPEIDQANIDALMTVFGSIGSLGFRSRRCMGAIAFHDKSPMPLNEALSFFNEPENICLFSLDEDNGGRSAELLTKNLSTWLKEWRSHGRSPNLNTGPGFKYAKKDHDLGLGLHRGPAYRPALGLPIIQRYSSGTKKTNQWEYIKGDEKTRFASPVILRPFRLDDKKIKAGVIFVEVYKWDDERDKVKVSNNTVEVSLELYNEMKRDPRLKRYFC